MMREMSYRDKMILLIISVIIILAAGFFALVRPKYNTMVADRNTYNDTYSEWEGIDAKIQQIEPLKAGITESYKEAKAIADIFVNDAFASINETFDANKSNLLMEQYLLTALDESELQVENMSLRGALAEPFEYYYYTPDVLTYSLLESADVNSNYAVQVTELLKESSYLEERETAEVMTNVMTVEVTGSKENLMTFLTKVNEEDKNAVRVTQVDISDYTFGEGLTQTITEQQTDAEGNVTTVTREVSADADSSNIIIAVTFYNAMPIDEPYLGD